MANSRYEWQAMPQHDSKLIDDISNACQIPAVLANVLIDRGCQTIEEAQNFLSAPQDSNIHQPEELHDMDKAVDRIRSAVEEGEKITIYGDYDADGITSTSLMYETLLSIGANVDYFIPDRFKDGYGPNLDEYQNLIKKGTQLIVTVDNGVSGYNEIAYAQEHGVDVVITDHHKLPEKLPNAVAIVHPRYPGDEYPYADLSGVGVAFKVAWGILEEPPVEDLDLVAIGEIADVVSLKGENHDLVAAGLQQLRQGQRPGVHALLELSNAEEANLTEQDIGFQLAPRLNALGRVDNANKGVQLLTTTDPDEAKQLAQFVDDCNKERRDLVAQVLDAALKQVDSPKMSKQKTLLLVGHDWNQGVLGIVASHVVEKTGKPTIVASVKTGESIAKGSGRSVEHFDMFAALDGHRDLMESFGGHTMACGLSFNIEHTADLAETLEAAADEQGLKEDQRSVKVFTGQVDPQSLNLDFYNQLQRLAPFGPDNEMPVFKLNRPLITNAQRIGQNNQYAKLQIQAGTGELDVLTFDHADSAMDLLNSPGQLFVTVGINRWRGQQKVQLMMVDSQTGPKLTDWRQKAITANEFNDSAVFVIFEPKLLQNVASHITQPVYGDQEISQNDVNGKKVVVVDCPPNLSRFMNLMKKLMNANEINLQMNPSFKPINVPNRQYFVKFFHLIREQGPLDLNRHSYDLIRYLRLQQSQVQLMINVFLDLKFVTMENGFLKLNDQLQAGDLQNSKTYASSIALQKVNTVLLQSSFQQLCQWMNAHLD